MGDLSDFFHSYEKWVTKSEKGAWTIIYAIKLYPPSWQNTAGTGNDTVFTEETIGARSWILQYEFFINPADLTNFSKQINQEYREQKSNLHRY